MVVFNNITDRIHSEKLDELNKYKDNLLANVSHDLRAPINDVNGMLETAKNSEDIGQIKEYIDDALNCCQLGKNMLNDILDNAQIKKGSLRLNVIEI